MKLGESRLEVSSLELIDAHAAWAKEVHPTGSGNEAASGYFRVLVHLGERRNQLSERRRGGAGDGSRFRLPQYLREERGLNVSGC